MDSDPKSFLDRVLDIVKDEAAENVPLVQFKHPNELEAIFQDDLDISKQVNDTQLEKIIRKVLQYSIKTNKPTFRNQLYGGTDPYGLSGAWVAEAFNTSQYTFEVAPAFTIIELNILSHILKLFGIPDGDGIFSPGGSISMLYAIVAARFKAFPEVKKKGLRNLPEMIIFTSTESHYSIMKAAHWLGFGTESVRKIKTNDSGQMIVKELDEAIKKELQEGRYPVLVNATAGTTVLGGIDDLEKIADVCNKYKVWMNVDACWGGSLILSQNFRHKLKGVDRADSILWNPHKMVGAPLQCSVFLIREKGLLHESNAAAAEYLFNQDKFYNVSYDTGDKSIQCGRKIDAFKLWVMWKARGDIGFNYLLDHVMEMAEFCLEIVSHRPGFKLVSSQIQCPNVCFWYIPSFMRTIKEDSEWWEIMHKVTPKIKEQLSLNSRLMVAYTPLLNHKNFFRMAFTFHPVLNKNQVTEILQSIEECGEMVTLSML